MPRLEGWVLVGLLAVGGATWAFVELADEVMEGETRSIDRAVLLLFRTPDDHADPIGPGWIEEMARDFTALGGVGILTILICAVSGFFWLRGSPRTGLFTLAASGSGLGLSTFLKFSFDRPRPDLVSHE